MEVSLPPKLDDFVRAQARSGRYADEQEVVRDAVRQMRALVKAAEDPTVAGLVRDAMGIANQAQRDVAHVLQIADRETSVLGDVVGHAASLASAAVDVVRKVPGARELDRVVRGPIDLLDRDGRAGRGPGEGDAPEPRGDRQGARPADDRARAGQQCEPYASTASSRPSRDRA